MVKSFRFLVSLTWVNLGAIFGFAAIIIVGCYATGVSSNVSISTAFNLFENYYVMYPSMILMMVFLYAFSLCTNNLNLGLSMGARRWDFFVALQGTMAVYALICWAVQLFMCAFPALANWEVRDSWELLRLFERRPWVFPLLCMVLMVLGCLSGMVVVRSKILGVLLITLAVLVMIGTTAFLLLSVDPRTSGVILTSEWEWLWTTLPKAALAVLTIGAVGGEFMIWRCIQRFVVR